MGERFGLLGFDVESGENVLDGLEPGDERNDFHFFSTEAADQMINLEDFLNQLSPGKSARKSSSSILESK